MDSQVSPLSPGSGMADYVARMNTALKGTAGVRDVNGLISLKAILKYRHGSEPAVSLFKIKPWISVPKKICDNQNVFEI